MNIGNDNDSRHEIGILITIDDYSGSYPLYIADTMGTNILFLIARCP